MCVFFFAFLQSMWIERTTFMTSNSFPGVISWFEVSDTDSVSAWEKHYSTACSDN